ncbi:hypothetical protein QBC36DRAFT_318991 [Triangularia setosa]|uniref:Zn(2)-C6 fungal-type domain-containing protein n=1 Tax=Triangularia setosa TaxID=2587417 RepID=A0AAN7ACE6_9PEZI|nr:hypothetical protein QBC36DRAFT_318991 [Podospora setosa]
MVEAPPQENGSAMGVQNAIALTNRSRLWHTSQQRTRGSDTDEMNELPPSSAGKRAACDRCHALKMRCVVDQTDGFGGQRRCRRCHGARVACNYSVPGRSGRPPTKPGGQLLTTNTTRPGLVSTPSSLFSSIQLAPSLASTTDARGFSFAQKTTPISPRSNSWTDTVALLQQEPYATSPWDSLAHQDDWMGGQSLAESRYLDNYNPSQPNMHPTCPMPAVAGPNSSPQTQASTGTLDLSPDDRPRRESASASSAASPPEPRYDGQQYLQRLSEFNVRLSHPVGFTPDGSASSPVSPDQLEHAATHILSSSTAFLELISYPSSTNTPTTPDMAARLQLLVSYMRLTELHCGLYAAVYGYLKHATPNSGEKPPDFGFGLAGVSLSPSPRFQLQVLLQTAAHYLCSIQEALGLPAPLQLKGLRQPGSGDSVTEKTNLLGPPGSAETAMLVHTLMMHDQERRLQGMVDMLERLKSEFGIMVMFPVP